MTTLTAAVSAAGVASKHWDAHDTRLIGATVAGIAIIVGLIVAVKMHPVLGSDPGLGVRGLHLRRR